MFLLTPVRVYICNPMQLKLCSSTLVHLALFEHAAQQHTQLCSSTHSSARAHTALFEHTGTHSSVRAHVQLCSCTRMHMQSLFRNTQLWQPCLHHLLVTAPPPLHYWYMLLLHCVITCSPRLLVMLLQLSSDRSACSVVDGLETVAAMVVLSQPGPCARHVRRGISHHQKPAVWSRLSLSRCNPQLQRTLACCHGPRRFELRLGHSKFVGLGLLI